MNLQVGGRSRIWSSTASLASRRCSKGDGRGSEGKGNGGPPVDWDKAWSNFGKKTRSKKKRMISNFDPDKYVSWNPKRSEYPLSEEIDPIKKAERSNLMLWTSPRFTLVGAILLLSLLLVYTILFPLK